MTKLIIEFSTSSIKFPGVEIIAAKRDPKPPARPPLIAPSLNVPPAQYAAIKPPIIGAKILINVVTAISTDLKRRPTISKTIVTTKPIATVVQFTITFPLYKVIFFNYDSNTSTNNS